MYLMHSARRSSLYWQTQTSFLAELKAYIAALSTYINRRLFFSFYRFERAKHVVVGGLTAKRGKYVRPFLHTSMTGLFLLGLAVTPLVKDAISVEQTNESSIGSSILGMSIEAQAAMMSSDIATQISNKPEDAVLSYIVQDGDTLSSIAKKFNLQTDTLRWNNNLKNDSVKAGDTINIPPVDGIVHKVKRGDTIYSIAKKYAIDPQVIVNWPFNTYTDDENFGLAVGQLLIVPDGVMPAAKPSNTQYLAGRITPNAGAVAANGSFIWPTNGTITQRFVWYHTGLDIANASAPDILAADSGTVIQAGWPDNVGYGNRVIIDHGNGFVTLYAHMQAVYVSVGQTVNRGDSIGKMGSTGRSTGTHCHFEIRVGGKNVDPLTYLQ